MKLADIIARSAPPAAWGEGDNIPWSEPRFSERMLAEHLSQAHDRASRRSEIIDRHVEWIHGAVLGGASTRVLDLCCGPGLYTSRLARLGHDCLGIDYSPASIAHARAEAEREALRCEYLREDVRVAEYGSGFGLAMLLFGELNVFRRHEAAAILRRARAALAPGGVLVLEPHTEAAVKGIGESPPSWYASEGGLFSDDPHVCLTESFWDPESRTATTRYFIIDAATGAVDRHASTFQAYSDAEYASVLSECGFEGGDFLESLGEVVDESEGALMAIVARKIDDNQGHQAAHR